MGADHGLEGGVDLAKTLLGGEEHGEIGESRAMLGEGADLPAESLLRLLMAPQPGQGIPPQEVEPRS